MDIIIEIIVFIFASLGKAVFKLLFQSVLCYITIPMLVLFGLYIIIKIIFFIIGIFS